MSFKTPEEVVAFIKEEGVEFVDVRFTDVPAPSSTSPSRHPRSTRTQ